jgi:hypothetical protein
MNEPRRLREVSGSPVEHALLSAGASYRSSAEAHAKTLGALGLAGSAALSVGVAGASSSSLLSKLGWTKLISLLSVGAAVVVPVSYLALRDSAPAAEQRVAAARVAPVSVVTEPGEPASVSASTAQTADPSVAAAAEALDPAPAARGLTARVAKADSVAAELGIIESARSALARGDTAGALSRLDNYARTYPRGRLALEGEVLRIDALARSGQGGLAAKRAEAFLRRYPNSVLASRVRGYLSR